MKGTNQHQTAPQPDPIRFSVAKDGSIDVKANIHHSELVDLPKAVTDLTSEMSIYKFSDAAKAGFAAILDVVSKFFPNEFEQRSIYRQMEENDRD